MISAIIAQGIGFGGVNYMPTLGFSTVGEPPSAYTQVVLIVDTKQRIRGIRILFF